MSNDMKMFGVTDIDQYLEGVSASLGGPAMAAMSVLSDAQFFLAEGGDDAIEQARQRMNCAKIIISELLVAKKVA